MGNVCCTNASDSRIQEIEEELMGRISFNADFIEEDPIFIQTSYFDVQKSKPIVHSLARQYLNTKYFSAAKTFKANQIQCKVLFSALPNPPEIKKIEERIPLFVKPEETDQNFPVFPPVQLPTGQFYFGQWDLTTKSPSGFGTILEIDNSKYIGSFFKGQKSGKGRLIRINGDILEGIFKNDLLSGFGTLTKSNGIAYKGTFEKGKEHGEGVIEYEGEEVYKGGFFQGFKHGLGTLKIGEGNSYSGEFVSNCMEGQGKYVWEDGKVYEGGWKGNKLHGEGKYVWPDGREYYGCYSEGNRDGFGIFKWPDGREYRGEWYRGDMHGVGTYTYVDKGGGMRCVKAYWEHGKRKRVIQ